MKIFILGGAGYIGVPLASHFKTIGHTVYTLDNFSRKKKAVHSLTGSNCGKVDIEINLDRLCPSQVPEVDAVVHLAHHPSAPFSMIDYEHTAETQSRNLLGTLKILWILKEFQPNAHLINLGSMGVYGTPPVDIPEGFIESGPMKGMSFPKQPGSFYHLSKVFCSMNTEFACRNWGLKATEINQGVVFGLNYWDEKPTRFDYDEYFGTVINRFVVQALAGIPLTVYGKGGQTRGYLPLSDSIECLTLALDNPPKPGEYRVFNQYAKIFSVNELAEIVVDCASELRINATIERIKNPRKEAERHTYETTNQRLRDLGYNPAWGMKEEVKRLITALEPCREKINTGVIMPKHSWV